MPGPTPTDQSDIARFIRRLPDVIVWQMDEDAKLTDVSDGVVTILGNEAAEVLADPDLWTQRVYSRHRKRYQQTLDLVRESGESRDIDYRATLPDARAVWLRDHIARAEDSKRLYGITTRIDDQRDTEERLAFLNKAGKLLGSTLLTQELISKLAELITGSLADVCIVEVREGDETQVAVGASLDRTLGRELEALGPMLLSRPSLPARLKKGRPILYSRLTNRQLSRFVGPQRAKLLRSLKPHAAILAPLSVRSRVLGTVTFLCADSGRNYVVQDVELAMDICRQAATALDHARLFEEASAAQARLSQENEMKDEFLGLISHELRTPLTVIYGVSRILPRLLPDMQPDAQAMVEDLYSASERTVRLVEDLMLLARINLGEAPALERADVTSLLKEVGGDFEKQYEHRKIKIEEASGHTVVASPAFVRQILLNLLSNADKYSPNGAPVHLGAEPAKEEIVFYVEDFGNGVPEDELTEIFERFFRSSNSRGIAGAGMGLTICRRLVEAQGGRIWASRGGEGGFRVSFALPSA